MEDKSKAINGVVATFLGLTWIAVSIRLYIRVFMLRKVQLADYFIMLTQVCSFPCLALPLFSHPFCILTVMKISSTCEAAYVFLGVQGGIGNSNFIPTPENEAGALRNQLIIELIFCVTSTLLRVSIALQLWPLVKLQNFSKQQNLHYRSQRTLIITITSIIVADGIAWFFVLLFQCVPTDFFWLRALGAVNGTCLSNAVEAGLAYTQAVLSTISDLALGLLPIWILWGVNMRKRTKVTVAMLLGAGVIAGVVAVVRLIYTRHLIFDSHDFFGDPVPVILW
jgi:hypothetical protein